MLRNSLDKTVSFDPNLQLLSTTLHLQLQPDSAFKYVVAREPSVRVVRKLRRFGISRRTRGPVRARVTPELTSRSRGEALASLKHCTVH